MPRSARVVRMVHRMLSLLALAGLPMSAAGDATTDEPLPRDAEMRAALSAGPPHMAAQAGVYVLTPRGYELARESQNGFHCLVQRSFPGTFEPQCFDEEGSRTLMQETLMTARLRGEGRSEADVRAAVATAWAAGELRAPTRPGINYMLSTENRVPVDPEGKTIIHYGPHLMFYVPYLTNADLGVSGEGAPTFVINEGQPGAYAIVPVSTGGKGHGMQ